jgi:hypothetical protein
MIYSNQYNSHKWNYKNADWKGFTNACDIKFSCHMVSDNIQETPSFRMTILFSITWLYKWLPFVSFRLPPHNL